MHASFGPIRLSQTTASMIVSLGQERPLVFATGTSAPCTGIFKPYWVDAPPQVQRQSPQGQYDPETTFWTHERLHREVLGNYPDRIGSYQEDRNELEETYIHGGFAQHQASKEERAAYTANCFQKALEVEAIWLDRVQKIPEKKAFLHGSTWRKFNQEAGYL